MTTPAPNGDCGRLCEQEFWYSIIDSPDPRSLVLAELENGADPRLLRGGRMNPLAITIRNMFNPEIVRLLLEHGADPNTGTYSLEMQTQWTVLFEAVDLTAKFADLDDGQRYLDWHRGKFEEEWNQEYPQVPQWLENLGPATARANTVEIVRLLLEYGANAMARDDYGRLPLQPSYLQLPNNSNNNKRIGTHNPETVRLLLAYSEGLEPDGDDARELIKWAVFSQANEDIFELLFEYGIKPNLGFNGETTWLHLAAQFSVENVGTYQGLIDGGVDPQSLDDEGKTACDRLRGNEESALRHLKESVLGRELMLDDVAALLCD